VLRLFDRLRAGGQTLVIVTHDSRVAATADRLVSMRDGALVDETKLSGDTRGSLGRPNSPEPSLIIPNEHRYPVLERSSPELPKYPVPRGSQGELVPSFLPLRRHSP